MQICTVKVDKAEGCLSLVTHIAAVSEAESIEVMIRSLTLSQLVKPSLVAVVRSLTLSQLVKPRVLKQWLI